MRVEEMPICGLAAVLAVFAKEPARIRRLFFVRAMAPKVGQLSRELARTKRVYRLVEAPELEKIAGTLHHGGVVAMVEERALPHATREDFRRWAKTQRVVLALDRVGNPHNLGAIVRTAAFFGVETVVIPDHPQQAKLSESAHRVAEGGMEQLSLVLVGDLPQALRELSREFHVVGTAVVGATSLVDWANKNGRDRRPVVVVLGNEEKGLSKEVAAACTHLVTIPGSGKVESLNVSVAASILLWEFYKTCR